MAMNDPTEASQSPPGSPRIDATFEEWLDDYVAQNLEHGVWAAGVARPTTETIAAAVRDQRDGGDAMDLLRWLMEIGIVWIVEADERTIWHDEPGEYGVAYEHFGLGSTFLAVPPHLVDIARQLTDPAAQEPNQ